MFQRVLLAWRPDQQSRKALELARSLAGAYEAELAVCGLGVAATEVRAAVGPDVPVVELPGAHADRELVRYAHEHAFDLLVVGRVSGNDPLPRQLIESASMPVLAAPIPSAGNAPDHAPPSAASGAGRSTVAPKTRR